MRYQLETVGKSGIGKVKAEVRVMPGNPYSPHLTQQKPYVKHSVNGKFFDKHGNIAPRKSAEAHIPINEYNFERTGKL